MVTKHPELLGATRWVQEKGNDPSRIVLWKHFLINGKVKEWVTHMEVKHPRLKGKSAYYHGHYFTTLVDAEKDYEKRRKTLGGN